MIPSDTTPGAPITFLVLRSQLAEMRDWARTHAMPPESVAMLDAILSETEETTMALLFAAELPEGDIDGVFDDEMLEVCAAMGIDLPAWIGKPEVLLRLRDPDRIIAGWLEIANMLLPPTQRPSGSHSTFEEQVVIMEQLIDKLASSLKDI